MTVVGSTLARPDNFYGQANVIFDLLSLEQFDGLVMWTTALG